MTDKLPPQLLALFQPRPPLRYIPPQDNSPEDKATIPSKITGLAAFLTQVAEIKNEDDDDYVPTESWLQRRDRMRFEKQAEIEAMQKDDFEGFKPDQDHKIKGDAVKTLFIGRLAFDVKESELEREFGRFGPIERIRIVKDDVAEKPKKSSKGYAFIVYEREKDMRAAYKETDGIRIKDRRVVVDVERGRMVSGWKPRRFGGGLGGRGYTKQAPAKPTFGGPPASGNFGGGGFRGDFGGGRGGGFRGGFRGGRGGFGGDRGGFGGDRGGFGGDRGGYGGDRGGFGGRGGIGYQGGGGFGGRGGYQNGPPPANAPSGPGGRGPGGYEDRRNGYSGGDRSDRGGGDRGGSGGYGGGRDQRGGTGGNREPVGGRDRGYEDRDRDRDRERDRGYSSRRDDDHGSRKRQHENDGYDDSRSKRRY